jgi:hypothetical protein
MKNEDEKIPKPAQGVVVVPSEVRDIDFSEQAHRPRPAEYQRKKVPLNPGPLPQGKLVPPGEVLNQKDEESS